MSSEIFGAIGCFIGTLISLFSFNYWQYRNPFFFILLPMWGMILGFAISAVVAKEEKKKKTKRK